jgi:uncharacterized membrane protein YebE (DUF533 family)
MLGALSHEERMRLMKFVCAFAWADLHVQPAERAFIAGLVEQLELEPHEEAQVEAWIAVPPAGDQIDPAEIPRAHRQIFLRVIDQLARADGRVYKREWESLALLRDLLGG